MLPYKDALVEEIMRFNPRNKVEELKKLNESELRRRLENEVMNRRK